VKFMNFSRRNVPGLIRIGCAFGDSYFDVTKAIGDDLLEFPRVVFTLEEVLQVRNGLETLGSQLQDLERSRSGIVKSYLLELSDVVFQPPVIRPLKLIGIGLNYKDHAEEVKLPLPKLPLIFAMYSNAIIAHNQAIVIPPMSKQVDYEAELGVVIGRQARRVSASEALQYVAAYTIINDVSARDLQFTDGQWLRAKSFDTFAPMGPYLTTREALGAADNLSIEFRLNGKTLQKSNTRNLIFKVPELVSYLSEIMTLEIGDVIATGTPAGVGFARQPQIFMNPGDVAEVEIEGIGILRNPVVGFD
jgi:2-keto-4-pentenoate hydratase/2-oxohepta-3-ene-1,7-dioic acid hydratase in catechol pathway